MISTLFRNISNIKGRGEVFYLLTIRINHPVILFISSWTSFLVLRFCYSYICLVTAYWIGGSLKFCFVFISSVQFSRSVMSNSLQSHGLQHARLPYDQRPEPTQTHGHHVGDTIQPSHPLVPFSSHLNLS